MRLCCVPLRISDIEYTRECIVFDLLGIPLYHGWLVDAEDSTLAVGSLSYNQLVEKIIENATSADHDKAAQGILHPSAPFTISKSSTFIK